jgi:predicted Zn-dependent protease
LNRESNPGAGALLRMVRHTVCTVLRRSLLSALAVSLACAGPAAAQAPAPLRLPSLGESASDDLPVSAEKRLGEAILREARRDPDFLDDPVLLAYVQALWQPLLAAARDGGHIDTELERQFAWEVFLVRDRSVNAFAWPGGYVGVHLGLIALTANRDQLASVLAHELVHVTQRHIARGIGNSQRASLITLASVLLGILAASRANNADAANAAIATGQAAGIQTQLNFSRDMEREADRIGYSLFTQAGYATAGMAQMFERLDSASRINDNGGFPYLRSHPLTTDRISEARNRFLLAPRGSAEPALLHAMMQLRARVLMDANPPALQRLAAGGSSSPSAIDRVAALYGGAAAQLALGQPARAEALAREALEQAARLPARDAAAERAITLLQAEALAARGDAPAAVRVLAALAERGAQQGIERPVLLMQARAALAWGRQDARAAGPELRRSTEALQTWVSERAQDAQAWDLLAGTAEAIGQKLRSMRAAAEARAVLGDLTGAIDRLRAAQAQSRSGVAGQEFIEASVIDARLRQLMAERRQIALDARAGRGEPRREPDAPPQ